MTKRKWRILLILPMIFVSIYIWNSVGIPFFAARYCDNYVAEKGYDVTFKSVYYIKYFDEHGVTYADEHNEDKIFWVRTTGYPIFPFRISHDPFEYSEGF